MTHVREAVTARDAGTMAAHYHALCLHLSNIEGNYRGENR